MLQLSPGRVVPAHWHYDIVYFALVAHLIVVFVFIDGHDGVLCCVCFRYCRGLQLVRLLVQASRSCLLQADLDGVVLDVVVDAHWLEYCYIGLCCISQAILVLYNLLRLVFVHGM